LLSNDVRWRDVRELVLQLLERQWLTPKHAGHDGAHVLTINVSHGFTLVVAASMIVAYTALS
jgi:hypothetical protein